MKIEIELGDLKKLLREQKQITAERLLANTSSYNPKSTDGHSFSIDIDKNKFITLALASSFPDDIKVLEKYLPKS